MEIFACKPVPGGESHNYDLIAVINAFLIAGMLLASLAISWFDSRRWSFPVLFACLFLFHPLWCVGASIGDCGLTMFAVSLIYTGIGSIGLLWQVIGLRRLRRKPKSLGKQNSPILEGSQKIAGG